MDAVAALVRSDLPRAEERLRLHLAGHATDVAALRMLAETTARLPLGFLNPRLYALGGFGQFGRFGRDITLGNNAYGGVPGYSAAPGWDPASGWGTPDLSRLPSWWSAFVNME